MPIMRMPLSSDQCGICVFAPILRRRCGRQGSFVTLTMLGERRGTMTNMNTNGMMAEDRARAVEAIERRHSVRSYTSAHIDAVARRALGAEIAACNAEGGLHLQLVCDEEQAFSGRMAKYGRFENVRNYIACIGPKGPDLDERLGYYGERVVLLAQTLGLNTCWVALTFSKGKSREVCEIGPNEKLVCVISLGQGTTQGKARKSKTIEQVSKVERVASVAADTHEGIDANTCEGKDDGARADGSGTPAWFVDGVAAALLAPTAMNQQKFMLTLRGNHVHAESTGGFYSKIDLGIVKYHFEVGSGKDASIWV